ncbi:glutamate-1-semialdehyde 2,1-aminomutase [Lachnospiraceae bacterium JLR.KK008]
MQIQRSQELYREALTLMPGGVNSPVRAFGSVGGTPLFIRRAQGDRLVDEDGNSWIDYVCSWGPCILGHAHPQVVEAVREAVCDGLTYGAPTEKEVRLAGMIRACMPSMEKLRLVNSGTEAVMSAIRAARGYTGREKIVKFRGCYHGHSDSLLVKAGSAALTGGVPDSAGVPVSCTEHTLIASYNDREDVERLFAAYGEQVACLIVEPVAANMGVVLPQEGFLEFLREITEKYGAVLIFDEVITGFRLGIGGAQAHYHIAPDLTTLGKIAGGGMPLAVYGGRKEIMDCVAPLGSVYQAGTLSGNPIATTAGIATLSVLMEHPQIYDEVEEKAARLASAYEKTGRVQINRIGSLLCAFFAERPVTDYDSAVASDTGTYARYFKHMLDYGIYVAPSQFEAMFVSAAHSAEDIEKTARAVETFA